MAGAAPLPNIPLLAASYANLSQGMTAMSNDMTAMSNDMAAIGNETALFANVPAVNFGNQLAQINAAIQALTNTVTVLAATVAANHQTAQANHQQLAATVANNHQAVLNTVAANHQTSQASLAAINANLDLQPMRLANAATPSNSALFGPTLAPLADPHPTKRDQLVGFTIAQCNNSADAFEQAGYTLPPLPNGANVHVRRNRLARFLGVQQID